MAKSNYPHKQRSGGSNRGALIALLVLLIIAAAVFLLRSCTDGKTPDPAPGGIVYDPGAVEGGWNEADTDKIVDALNEKVEQGMINISMNTTPTFQNGSSAGNLMIVNESVNNYPQVVEIHRNDTGEVIYKSGAIPVGSKLETAKLSADLDAGTYECTAPFLQRRPRQRRIPRLRGRCHHRHRSGVTVFHFVTMPQGGQYILQAERRKEKNL